ncbi:response regulator transcription factor [Phytohabitans sp. ZYX-F-186]|uniref:Response regulator transcription factor n=1 Tax=Phytohabitans maris TaxID=3071409 RepID=A0ABU0Z9C0_9ACTN|nr:response regulator transcription factor [Phytohabitans sp. ZYX-F-186]MDQ7903646.1 response regulator transcription factor [Phytohabitans sp. ZYX-F-186]
MSEQGEQQIRVFIVDDHCVVRSGVRAEIGDTVVVVGEAGDVASAVSGVRTLQPDVVLLDVHLPDGGGRAILDAVAPSHPHIRFLALSVSDSPDDVLAIVRAGARGYVTKAITGPDLCQAIARVHAGDAYFSPRLAVYVLDAFRGTDPVPHPDLDRLTSRERDVLRLIAAGYTYPEAATRLHISSRTIETHAAAVLRKLQLSNRRELARWAKANHLT